ncbi:helix-turn-helix domain-containing GNAT family N-acetyltransferase [Sphingomonas sp. BIUV-7]|uniref:Helix-turn-helix domain-containing GNAT family N-acetyltransferase n=1 Tax=Sphingomonas natans TaxID=3063330 RepID=A0ABT8Y614_9SPHN|nr:helix-turn-helix domain-containing GNAT family N-acetyltransferase [Sphingomonas sp. BIUV-7]MDO6413764.1 helix-turn-helix domain-containing GNAT family N-acetyltransferase [Sphingomonas sp. BIUV-7]
MDQIETVRSFNRFYTRAVGALSPRFLDSEMSLPEARLLFEIAQEDRALAADIGPRLGMDAGYLSRLLARFESRGWIERPRDAADGRRRPILLAPAGRALFADLDRRQRAAVVAMLEPLAPAARSRATEALGEAQALLSGPPPAPTIRTFRPGDMGLIAARQAILYQEGWDWGRPMEVLLGEVTTGFLRDFQPGREQCWVGEVGGRMAGSIFCTDGKTPGLAKLRLLYVEPFARGLGLGELLVDACVGFARDAGYETMELWTHTILTSARRIYAAKGFHLTRSEMHDHFGEPVQGEYWRLNLRPD